MPRLYAMLVGALGALADREPDPFLVAPAFFLKALVLEGAGPVLDECASCGESDGAVELVAFDLVAGGALCRPRRSGRADEPRRAGPHAPHPRWGPGRRLGRRTSARCRGGGRAGHRGHGDPPGPPPPLGALHRRACDPVPGERAARSASTSTSPSVGLVATTAPSPPTPTATTSWSAMWTRASTSCIVPSATATCRGPPRSSSEGARRRGSTPRLCAGSSMRCPAPPGAEVTVECNPEDADPAQVWPPIGRPASPGSPSACSPPTPTCWPGSGRRNVARRRRDDQCRSRGGRLHDVERRPHLRGRRRARRRLGRHPRARAVPAVPRRPHISAYALTVEPGTPLAADPRHPDEEVQARRYELADALLTAAGLPLGGDLQLGPARPPVPPQPASTGTKATTWASARPPTRTATGAVVERAHPRALHRRRRGRTFARGRGARC